MQHLRTNPPAFSPARCFLRVFDALGFGVVLIGDARKVLHLNGQAERHLGPDVTLRSERLYATNGAADRMLQALLTAHLDGEDGAREIVGLQRREWRPLILRVVSLPENVRAAFEGARLALFFVDPEFCPEPPPELLLQAFGLTRREAKVATQLMCGCTLQEIADETGVGIGTVRAQTKAILAKTGTNRQAELVGFLTRLAIVSGKSA
ncbi:helix-turn-helix transcriptional regulator [Microvirga sp. 17 mud 1-3]|uniref:helix-turn-helix transcriptional regulator n=1 Tax=Microvirga sp. 17 mud 1-3 TaxID=2082949 RepID=UPI000D6BBF22|nr:helix-turn-helix transcriptional regulator [Microvirga sp. 17 mud 1-3]AWM87225.1 hypothetical protein C4E04_11110 [Microvirga sp. 17 mud 1-3]